ncbi:hypothetical protein KKH23_02980 [Patescibacteria group bacterium]|nr:hypothetical protein [Patescibacteria group bacterium]MBU0776685.1 hypothetical protein [Patescibacteria group bacterium]MBU0846129.1 hypothetical protein [Patescibacteria group bacterium]MBU0922782.1 hypothetical protein [Patescibacteria group bacterium]MBU1066299.1 hypothetical protein [Patescibacteria group bacterium]
MNQVLPIIGVSIWLIAKVLVLFALVIYGIFAFVVLRQIQLMTDTLEVGFEGPIRMLGISHLVFSLVIFVLALIIL